MGEKLNRIKLTVIENRMKGSKEEQNEMDEGKRLKEEKCNGIKCTMMI